MCKVFLIEWGVSAAHSRVVLGKMQFNGNKIILFENMLIDFQHMQEKYVWTRALRIKVLVLVVLDTEQATEEGQNIWIPPTPHS